MSETHKFKKRFIIIPIGVLVITVAGFSTLKSFDKRAATPTETKTTATTTIEIGAASPAEGPNQNMSVSKANSAMLNAVRGKEHLQLSVDVLKEKESFKAQQQRWYAQLVFSGLMTMASLYVILSKKYPDDINKWGYSTIAFILGYWLQGL